MDAQAHRIRRTTSFPLALALTTPTPHDPPTDDSQTDDALTGDALTDDALTDDALTDDALTGDALTDDALTGSFRVWQRKRGHRYSLDDVTTARDAVLAHPKAERVLDLGCGIGSVLLMVAFRLRSATFVGIEAQELSYRLAKRNLARNGVSSRAQLVLGDLREVATRERVGTFDLVTGTPPYAPLHAVTPPPDPQKRYARVELRGGVEAYMAAASRVLAPRGRMVMCAGTNQDERVREGAVTTGLVPLRRTTVAPRAHRNPLFSVWTFAGVHQATAHLAMTAPQPAETTFTARDAQGERTDEYRQLRAFFGL